MVSSKNQYDCLLTNQVSRLVLKFSKLNLFTMYSIAELKVGTNVDLEGEPYKIVWNQFSKTGRQGGVMSVKLKNLKTGQVIPRTFQGADKITPAEITMRKAQFLYKDSEGYHFMNGETYDQFTLNSEAVGEAGAFLKDGEDYHLMYFGEDPINVNLPVKMDFVVVETTPGVRGDTAQGGTKPAKLDCGLTVAVPLFIDDGEKIRINTETLEYVERVTEKN